MNGHDFTTFSVDETPDEAFNAIINVRGWWSEECFEICSNAWGFYINGSLRSLITTGEGQPIPKEAGLRASRAV